jgi:hypothetical protein
MSAQDEQFQHDSESQQEWGKLADQANEAPAPMDYKQTAQFILKPILALTKRP